ncbi:MAG: hypothetical protein FJX62_14130 [Alphaproteobacteria bacterium]|nr:hypothetical protein [Alphaproteobacteria bacterium]
MIERPALPYRLRPDAAIVRSVSQVAALWVASDAGFYFLLPMLGVQISYNSGSVAITLYYFFWSGIAVITFWDRYIHWVRFENRLASYLIWCAVFAGCTLFAAYVLPQLAPTKWTQPWTPPDVVVATPWYFLPKSVDILFQQLLIVALVLGLAEHRFSVRQISMTCAVLFGAMHLLLAFGGMPLGYVLRFMVAAAIFGLIFPSLILNVPNGFAFSYMAHWTYYAITVVMPRIFSAPSP